MGWITKEISKSEKIKIPVCRELHIILIGAGSLFDNLANTGVVYSARGGGGGNAENLK